MACGTGFGRVACGTGFGKTSPCEMQLHNMLRPERVELFETQMYRDVVNVSTC